MSAGTEVSPKQGDIDAVDIDGDLKELKMLSIPLTSPVQVTSYLNERFPTQSALVSGLDSFSTKLSAAESRVDLQLATLMHMHRHDTTKTATAITETDAAVTNLREELTTLTKSAAGAQANMENALKPAMPVFTALQNVSATLDALDAVVKLDESVRILEHVTTTSNLSILINNNNDTIQMLDRSLKALDGEDTRQIKGVGALRSRALVAREGLRATILNAFKLQSDAVSNMDSATTEKHTYAVKSLQAACNVAEMMGSDVKAEVIGAFVRRRRASLRAAFASSEQGVKVLGETERRFAWVRRELRTHWAHLGGERINRGWGRVFPSNWFVAKRVADGLIAECRDAIAAALDAGAHLDVDTMIMALAKAKEFEVELNRRFEMGMSLSMDHQSSSGPNSPTVSSSTQGSFLGSISDCFGPWMNTFVNHEENQLGSTLSQLIRDETWQSEYDMNVEKYLQDNNPKIGNTGKGNGNGGTTSASGKPQSSKLGNDPLLAGADRTAAVVLKSATELFLAIKKSMRTCAALDVRQPLFSLHRVFRKHLATYASVLVRHLPGVRGKNVESSTISSSSSSSERPDDQFDNKLIKACAIINTAHYCAVTTEQLEERVRETIAMPFKTDVDLSPERERFGTVCARGIQSVVALTEEYVDVHLRTISTRDWSELKEVGDTSLYIDETGAKLTAVVEKISRRLSRTHLRFLLEKLAGSVISRVRTHLYRCSEATGSVPPGVSSSNGAGGTVTQSGISGVAAQQLLLDVTSLRGILVGLPASVHAATASTFVKLVNRDIGRVEAVLKVILSPLAACVDTYVALVGEHGSAPDFQQILDMRGLKRAAAAPLVLDYSRRIAPAQRLRPAQRAGRDRSYGGSVMDRDGVPGQSQQGDSETLRIGASASGSSETAAAVDTMKNLFGRLGNTLAETGLTDRLEQVSSQFESTTDQLKKGVGVAAGRWNLFGNK